MRERHGFNGELRAVGDVLLDELPLMLRCGFTSFEIVNAPTLRALEEGRLPHFVLAYQPSFAKESAGGDAALVEAGGGVSGSTTCRGGASMKTLA